VMLAAAGGALRLMVRARQSPRRRRR
jgi:hypothetical protein